ncbi:MAG: YggS family pyridoxal phosphate-dependent enzyme [Gammaproteobacteria bacterium]|nr:YggS family pyridoxal phosphate-dependent enzyme [Gammaproteobacteria bacterium]
MLILPQNSPSVEALAIRAQALRRRIAAAATAAGRTEQQVTLVAVGKGQPAGLLQAAARLGISDFGENYLQEALPKLDVLADAALTWHFIGRLQANKTRLVSERFQWVHGVDRLHIAERLAAQRPHHAPPLNVLLQVNIAHDDAKAGVTPVDTPGLAAAVAALPRLALRGLMCMLPERLDAAGRRAAYAALRCLLEECNERGLRLDALSMGMSGDFAEAIAAGATHVRIGTALFGPRPAP